MNRLLFVLAFIITSNIGVAQITGYLYVKKGAKKKKTYTEGSRILLQLQDGSIINGLITLLRNDTIFLTGKPVPTSNVKAVLLPGKRNKLPADAKTMLLIGAGVGLTTIGLTLNGNESWEKALVAGLAIGYGGLVVKYLGKGAILALQRKKYRIGRKYRLQVLDFHVPRQRAF